jgi:hypothetical protein
LNLKKKKIQVHICQTSPPVKIAPCSYDSGLENVLAKLY